MEKLRFGIIGAGGMAHSHVRRISAMEETEIVAICDVNEDGVQAMIAKHALQGTRMYRDYQDMLAKERLDAVVIITPHTLHFTQGMDALHSGCHVLIEKPMATSARDAATLIETAEKLGKKLQVSYQRHFQPEFLYIKKAIEDGVIGRLTSVTASLHQDWKQLSEGTWRQDPALSGGGMLMDSGSHIVDVMLWTTGLTPEHVSAVIQTHGAPVELDTFASIKFREGAVGGLNIIGYAPGWHETYAFCGEKGGIFYENGRLTLRRHGQPDAAPELPPVDTNADRSFVDAILGRREVAVPGEFAKRVVQLTEQIYQAAGYDPKQD